MGFEYFRPLVVQRRMLAHINAEINACMCELRYLRSGVLVQPSLPESRVVFEGEGYLTTDEVFKEAFNGAFKRFKNWFGPKSDGKQSDGKQYFMLLSSGKLRCFNNKNDSDNPANAFDNIRIAGVEDIKDANASKPTKLIDETEISEVENNDSIICICLAYRWFDRYSQPSKKTYYLKCDNRKQRDDWIKKLKDVRNNCENVVFDAHEKHWAYE